MSPQEIQEAVSQAGLQPLTPRQAEQLSTYAALLQRWNSQLNLTAIRDPRQIVERHFVECLFCAQRLEGDPATLLDFGSGAGFPGIPIAVCRPNVSVTLAESTIKKASFLREALRTLDLPAQIFSGRVEAMPANATYDTVTLRAVDRMELAAAAAIERVRPGGILVLMTTSDSPLARQVAGVTLVSSIALPNSAERVLSQFRRP